MKKCVRCGNENLSEMQFCLNCGNALGQSTASGFNASSYAAPQNAFEPKKSNRKWWIAGAGGFVAILLLLGGGLVGLAVLLSGNRNTNRTGGTNARTVKTTPTSGNANSTLSQSDARTANVNRANQNGGNNQTDASSVADSASSARSDEPTKHGTFTISANKGWQLSDIRVVPRQMFRTTVEGKIDLGETSKNVLSKGVANAKERRLYPEYPTGALLMRTKLDAGGYSIMQAVTTPKNPLGMWQNAKDELGRLEFVVNDNQPDDNSGTFTVQFVSVSVPK